MRNIDSYRRVKVRTASPGQRVVLLYDGIMKNLREVLTLFDDFGPERIEAVNNKLQRACQIILELKLALDLENGGVLAENLKNLYEFWLEQISEANVKKDPELVQPVLAMVMEMRETWDQAEREARKLGAR